MDKIREGIGSALRTVLEKKVVPALEPLLENPKLEPELRSAIQDHLTVLIQRNSETPPSNNVNNGSTIAEAVSLLGNSATSGNKELALPDTLNLNYSVNVNQSTALLSPDPSSTVTTPSFPANVANSSSTTTTGIPLNSVTTPKVTSALGGQQNSVKIESSITYEQGDDATFSDDDDEDDENVEDHVPGPPSKPNGIISSVVKNFRL